ncbi:MAG: precorrin-2 dehydrogenase [Magnetococcales bacterium]|nr:precorrin-2 dehydrogenase [Magnetococcales bacterium]
MHYYMAELLLHGMEVWVIGGGTVATRKVRGLLDTGASICVVAPEFSAEILCWQEQGRLQVRKACFREQDLDGGSKPTLIFAATGLPDLNRAIAGFCRDRKLLCNSADDPKTSGFLVPAVVRRGGLTVAVGTQGASPALSRLLKERIERWLEPGWQRLVEVFGDMRTEVTRRLPNPLERNQFWRKTALLAEQEGCHGDRDPEVWFWERLNEVSSSNTPGDHPS